MNGLKVTNLRMGENDYLQAKMVASELGMSLNEYFNYLAREHRLRSMFPRRGESVGKRKLSPADLPKMAVEFKPSDRADWSGDDRAVYDH